MLVCVLFVYMLLMCYVLLLVLVRIVNGKFDCRVFVFDDVVFVFVV